MQTLIFSPFSLVHVHFVYNFFAYKNKFEKAITFNFEFRRLKYRYEIETTKFLFSIRMFEITNNSKIWFESSKFQLDLLN